MLKIVESEPLRILRYVNPLEAKLFDKGLSFQVRFRLGGEVWPPVLLYKIYINQPIIDMNSFSPRSYHTGENKCWYKRVTNNGWRVVGGNVYEVTKEQQIEKEKRFFHGKAARLKNYNKERKKKGLEWIKKFPDDEEWNDVVEWTKTLDFDKYNTEWMTLATTAQFEGSN